MKIRLNTLDWTRVVHISFGVCLNIRINRATYLHNRIISFIGRGRFYNNCSVRLCNLVEGTLLVPEEGKWYVTQLLPYYCLVSPRDEELHSWPTGLNQTLMNVLCHYILYCTVHVQYLKMFLARHMQHAINCNLFLESNSSTSTYSWMAFTSTVRTRRWHLQSTRRLGGFSINLTARFN